MPRRRDEPVRLTRIYTRGGDARRDLARRRLARVEARSARPRRTAPSTSSTRSSAGSRSLHPTSGSRAIQNELFDLGADLSVPFADGDGEAAGRAGRDRPARGRLRRGERALPELRSLRPARAGAKRRHACTSRGRCAGVPSGWCSAPRRERPVNPLVPVYLNRLSDLLFILARAANAGGDEPLWRPGGER